MYEYAMSQHHVGVRHPAHQSFKRSKPKTVSFKRLKHYSFGAALLSAKLTRHATA